MVCADEPLGFLTLWRQTMQFSPAESVQQELMRHADTGPQSRSTAMQHPVDTRNAHRKVVRLTLPRAGTAGGLVKCFRFWGGRRESNPQRPEPQSGALPVELLPPYPIDYSNLARVKSERDAPRPGGFSWLWHRVLLAQEKPRDARPSWPKRSQSQAAGQNRLPAMRSPSRATATIDGSQR